MRLVAFTALSVSVTALALWGVFHGGTPFVLLLLGLAGVGALVSVIVALVAKGTARRHAMIAVLLFMLPWLVGPMARAISRRMVLDAQGYCNDLIPVARRVREVRGSWPTRGALDVPGRARPFLLEQGRSVRYPFTFEARDESFHCRFPDPTGVRTFWEGEATPGGRWVWERLMD